MTNVETHKFDAEVGKVLHLMIHSLYTNEEIFLRELISNASDACDKLRYLSLTRPEILDDSNQELGIKITPNKQARSLTITDNGIGMDRDELIAHLGTIARSGTQMFTEHLTGDAKKDMQLIGQFGVGFYSSFMVAEKVQVISRKAGEQHAWIWTSTGQGEFSLEEAEGHIDRGTQVTLYLKEGKDEYLDKFRIRHIVTTYSDHISFPITLVEEDNQSTMINTASALWMRPKSDITEEQYLEFYKHVAHAGDTPWMTLHNKNEGIISYTNLLYIPSRKPFDLFHPDRKPRVKLYVKRVFITDEGVSLVPAWLRFIRGVVDSEDLPLNISRETLQHNQVIEKIKKSITKRVLTELKKRAEKDPQEYATFWEEFGAALKEGLCEGGEGKDDLLEVCRFYSSEAEGLVSLNDYISRMKPNQEHIYYFTGDQLDKLKSSPQLEGFKQRGIEVLLLTDTVDDFWVNVVHTFKEKELKSITRSGLELDQIAPLPNEEKEDQKPEETSSQKEAIDKLLETIKDVLGHKVAQVRITQKLADSPVCLSVPEGAMDIRMERFLIDQRQLTQRTAKILEVNPHHPIIKKLAEDVTSEPKPAALNDMIQVLFDQACIIEGEPVEDTGAFSKRLNDLLRKAIAA